MLSCCLVGAESGQPEHDSTLKTSERRCFPYRTSPARCRVLPIGPASDAAHPVVGSEQMRWKRMLPVSACGPDGKAALQNQRGAVPARGGRWRVFVVVPGHKGADGAR